MTTKNSRKPLSSKKAKMPINHDDVFGSRLSVPPAIKAEADKKGWSLRWVNSQEVYKNMGNHTKGWIVYKPSSDTIKNELGEPVSPAKEIRRGDLILAYKTAEQAETHKEFLRQRAERYSAKNKLSQQAASLRKSAGNMDISVDVGLDDNDE
jgi:hypothetical protein